MEFPVISVKRRQKTGFLGWISSKITLAKEKRKEKKKKKRKKTVFALLVFITAALAKKKNIKNCRSEKVHLAVTFSKIRIDI